MSLRQPAWTRIAPVLAIVVIVIGLVVTVLGFPHPASFGWFASAPLSEAAFDPNYVVIVLWSAMVGATPIAAGTALLCFWAGCTLRGSRARS
jgi:hypothetical protein